MSKYINNRTQWTSTKTHPYLIFNVVKISIINDKSRVYKESGKKIKFLNLKLLNDLTYFNGTYYMLRNDRTDLLRSQGERPRRGRRMTRVRANSNMHSMPKITGTLQS